MHYYLQNVSLLLIFSGNLWGVCLCVCVRERDGEKEEGGMKREFEVFQLPNGLQSCCHLHPALLVRRNNIRRIASYGFGFLSLDIKEFKPGTLIKAKADLLNEALQTARTLEMGSQVLCAKCGA